MLRLISQEKKKKNSKLILFKTFLKYIIYRLYK